MEMERYSRVAIALHWAIALLIIVNIPLGAFSDTIEEMGWNPVQLHKSLGLTVLALSIVRLGWRLTHRAPPLPTEVVAWQRHLSKLVHWLLYALIVIVPLTGWLRVSPGNRPLNWFGLFDVPKFPIVPRSPEAFAASQGHTVTAYVLTALAALHIVAALYHRYGLKDRVLARMLP